MRSLASVSSAAVLPRSFPWNSTEVAGVQTIGCAVADLEAGLARVNAVVILHSDARHPTMTDALVIYQSHTGLLSRYLGPLYWSLLSATASAEGAPRPSFRDCVGGGRSGALPFWSSVLLCTYTHIYGTSRTIGLVPKADLRNSLVGRHVGLVRTLAQQCRRGADHAIRPGFLSVRLRFPHWLSGRIRENIAHVPYLFQFLGEGYF